jgi:hypothetical protein
MNRIHLSLLLVLVMTVAVRCQLVTDFSHDSAVAYGGSVSEVGGSSSVSSGGKSSKDDTSNKTSDNGGTSSDDGTAGASVVGETVVVEGGAGGSTVEAGGSMGGTSTVGGTSDSGGSVATGNPKGATAPTVLSITPADGTKGVASDAPVQIVFSESMAATSVTSALSISGFTASELTLRWSENNTRLTVTTSSGFAYATGNNPTAKFYTVTVTTGAKNTNGISMATGFSSSFSALRRIQRVLAPEQVAKYDSFGAAVHDDSPIICAGVGETIEVGEWSGYTGSGTNYGYLLFNLESISKPSTVRSFDWVSLRAVQTAPTGSFYPGGNVFVARLDYAPLETTTTIAEAIDTFGVLSTSFETTSVSLDVTARFSSLFKAGTDKLLLRLAPSGSLDVNTYANFYCGGFGLELSYLCE